MKLTLRQKLAAILRTLHLLPMADFAWFLILYLRRRKPDQRFLQEHPNALVPPPMILYDILGQCDLWGYYKSGKDDASEIGRIISLHRNSNLRVLEWGCGPARVLQHLTSPLGQYWQLNGSDYNPRSIAWCGKNIPDIRFYQNNLHPPIPVQTDSFDVVFCISVFTHLSEQLHLQWIEEIHRVLVPGGLFIGTFHGEKYRNQLTLREQKEFDAGQFVVRGNIKEGKKDYTAFHADEFIHHLLSPFARHWQEPSAVFRQTVWCAEK